MNGAKLKCGKLKAESPCRTEEAGGQTAVAPADGMLTKKDLAARLRVTLRTIENWQHAGHLPFIKISNVVLFHWPAVLDHLNTHFKVQRRGAMSPRSSRTATWKN